MVIRRRRNAPHGWKKAARVLNEIRDMIEEGRISEEQDPEAFEAVGTILAIMRGQIAGRHTLTRLQAAITILEQRKGKAVQKQVHDLGDSFADVLMASIEREEKIRELPEPDPKLLEAIDVEVESVEMGQKGTGRVKPRGKRTRDNPNNQSRATND